MYGVHNLLTHLQVSPFSDLVRTVICQTILDIYGPNILVHSLHRNVPLCLLECCVLDRNCAFPFSGSRCARPLISQERLVRPKPQSQSSPGRLSTTDVHSFTSNCCASAANGRPSIDCPSPAYKSAIFHT